MSLEMGPTTIRYVTYHIALAICSHSDAVRLFPFFPSSILTLALSQPLRTLTNRADVLSRSDYTIVFGNKRCYTWTWPQPRPLSEN